AHHGADVVAQGSPLDVAHVGHVEDQDGHVVVHAEGDGGGVHHLELPLEDVQVGELAEADGGGVLLGVGGVDAVHLGGLHDDVRVDLHGAEGGGGVGGEVGV